MPPPIFTDDYIRKMCPENHPIPLSKLPVLGATNSPAYLAKGYTGIKYVPPPHRPPRTVSTLATMMAGTSNPEAVRSQAAVVENFLTRSYQTVSDVDSQVGAVLKELVDRVETEGKEETKAEVEVGTMGPTTPKGKRGGGAATPDSINKTTRGRGLPRLRKVRSDKGLLRGPQNRTKETKLMAEEDSASLSRRAASRPETRSVKKQNEQYGLGPSGGLRGKDG